MATRSELQHPRKLTQTEGSSSHHLWEEREQSRGWGAICGRKPDPRPAWRSAAQGTSERKKGVHAKGLRAPTVHPKKTGFDAVARPCSRGGGGASQHAGFVFAFAGFSMASAPLDFAGCRAIGGGLDPVLVLGALPMSSDGFQRLWILVGAVRDHLPPKSCLRESRSRSPEASWSGGSLHG